MYECTLRPPEMKATPKLPLLVYLHGFGEHRPEHRHKIQDNGVLSSKHVLLKQCYILCPICHVGKQWESTVIIDTIRKCFKGDMDARRIYITGISMGGTAIWQLLNDFPNFFAAAIPVCGGNNLLQIANIHKGISTSAIPKTVTAVWAFHGKKDVIIPVYTVLNLMQNLKKGRKDHKITIFNTKGHWIWKDVYQRDDIYEWLFAQKLPTLNTTL